MKRLKPILMTGHRKDNSLWRQINIPVPFFKGQIDDETSGRGITHFVL